VTQSMYNSKKIEGCQLDCASYPSVCADDIQLYLVTMYHDSIGARTAQLKREDTDPKSKVVVVKDIFTKGKLHNYVCIIVIQNMYLFLLFPRLC